MEHRSLPFEIKTLADTGVIEGIASDPTVDAYNDTVAPGAFTASIAKQRESGRPLPMLLHHDSSRPVGRWTDLVEKSGALAVAGKLTLDVGDARDAYALLKDQALTGLSIGFYIKREEQRADGVRVLKELDLVEISLVSFPANPNARVSAVKAVCGPRDIEELLRSAGMSGRKAKAAASAAWKAVNEQSDDDAAGAELAAILEASTARIAGMKRSYW